jgi:RNA polymerase sigma-70 factor (ECF subfamily)
MLAEDLVQETFVAALSGAGTRFAGRSSMRTWLIGILKHKIGDAFRDSARAPVSYDETVHAEAPAQITFDDEAAGEPIAAMHGHGIDPGPEAAFERKRFVEACQRQLDRLSAQGARAFVLSEVLGHDSKDVCAELGITSSNLWTTLHRMRRSLRSALAEVRPA